MAKRLPVSFKENDRDMRLYSYIMNEDDKSCFIKKAIEFYINHINSKSEVVKVQDQAPAVMDFESDDEGIGEIMGFN